MNDRAITITCSEYNERLDQLTSETVKITYEFYDDMKPPNMDAIIRTHIYKMRERLTELQKKNN